MGWDLNNFQELCASKGLPDSSVYQNSLFWKYSKALLLTDKSHKTWKVFWDSHPTLMNTQSDSVDAFRQAQIESETYIEAALQNVHSLADIVCQIINVVLLESTLREREVTVRAVLKKLEITSRSQVKTALENLDKSDEFEYVAAFVNTIKHRRLLDADYYGEFGLDKANTMGLRFKAFTYDKSSNSIKNYSVVLASTIINDYIPKISAYLDSLGAAIEESI